MLVIISLFPSNLTFHYRRFIFISNDFFNKPNLFIPHFMLVYSRWFYTNYFHRLCLIISILRVRYVCWIIFLYITRALIFSGLNYIRILWRLCVRWIGNPDRHKLSIAEYSCRQRCKRYCLKAVVVSCFRFAVGKTIS